MTERIPERQIRGMSEEIYAHIKTMYPDGAVVGTVRDLAGWE